MKRTKTDRLLGSMKQKKGIISNEMVLPNHSGDHQRSIKRNTPVNDLDLANKKYVDDSASAHNIASHSDTSATGAELNTLTDNSVANALHRHSELVASDGSPDPALMSDVDGRIGIGTSTPLSSLHVKSTGTTRLKIDTSANADTMVELLKGGVREWSIANDNFGSSTADAFYLMNAGSDHALTVLQDGKIGIGTTSPGVKLEVNGTTKFGTPVGNNGNVIELVSKYDNIIIFDRADSGSPEWQIGLDNSDASFLIQQGGNAFGVAADIAISIESNGRVGIGTMTPAKDLDVNGDITLVSGSGDYYSNDGSQGATGTFTTVDGKTVTVKNGIITNIV